MLTTGQRAQFENNEAVWLAFADGEAEVVRARITHPEPQQPSEVAVWWNGSATAQGVRDWVGHTMGLLNPSLGCQVKIWADGAPEETHIYETNGVSQLAEDIEKWAIDGAVSCAIVDITEITSLFICGLS